MRTNLSDMKGSPESVINSPPKTVVKIMKLDRKEHGLSHLGLLLKGSTINYYWATHKEWIISYTTKM